MLSVAEFKSLPNGDSGQRFAALERLCRDKMESRTDFHGNLDPQLQADYMSTVAAAAEELKIDGVSYPDATNPLEYLDGFRASAIRAATRFSLRSREESNGDSVSLMRGTRGQIELELQKLRQSIGAAEDLSPHKRDLLLKKLDEISKELSQDRVSFGKVFLALSLLLAEVSHTTSFFADIGPAIANVSHFLGHDKKSEDEAVRRLSKSTTPKALPSPSMSQSHSRAHVAKKALGRASQGRMNDVIDDNIPF